MITSTCIRSIRPLGLIDGVYLASMPLQAHHIPEAKFDPDQRRLIRGSGAIDGRAGEEQ